MNHIIIDLEFNSPYTNGYGQKVKNIDCPHEIIEIGAIKLDNNFNQIDSFRMFIKSTYYHIVSKLVCKKTGITAEDLRNGGIEFTKAIDIFLKWIGQDSQLYTWSENDYLVMKQNCDFHNIPCNWFMGYIDIQEDYRIFTNDIIVKSLTKTLDILRIPMCRDAHTGLSDAIYTGEILKYMNGVDILRIKERQDNETEESDKENSMMIKCPICGDIVEAEYESKGYSKTKRHYMLGICEACKVPIYHIIKRSAIEQYGNEFVYTVDTKIIKTTTYNNLKKDMFQNVKVET